MTLICKEATVILLMNQIVEEVLNNRLVGVVHNICYKSGETMGKRGARLYVSVEFYLSSYQRHLWRIKLIRSS